MNVSPFFKIEIFCPEESLDEILEALAGARAGEIGKYDRCASVTQVQGAWRPLEGSNPAFGEAGKLYSGNECKIEVNCREEFLAEAIQAVREVHPYEEWVINVIPLANARYGGTI
ncbi:MAG: divalent cation tolerance CutA family protein [Chloroflexi bacterium]|nr:MAG: divalent cation tolerance CutA family protein [Chloroflexota bacterium]